MSTRSLQTGEIHFIRFGVSYYLNIFLNFSVSVMSSLSIVYTYIFTHTCLYYLYYFSLLNCFSPDLKEKHFMSSIGFFWGMCAGLASPSSGLAQHAVWSEPLRDDDEGACSNGIAVCRSAAMKT